MQAKMLVLSIACFLTQVVEADVTTIELSAPVAVYDVSDPNFSWGRSPSPPAVLDAKKLRLIHGVASDEEFAGHLLDGSEDQRALAKAVSGGELKLTHRADSSKLTAAVTYKVSRNLRSEEVEQLRRYTYAQLVDGIGANFQQEFAEHPEGLWIAFEDIDYDELRVTPNTR